MSWIHKRVAGVTKVLTSVYDKTKDVAWAVGTTIFIVAYPLALSILDDRYLKENGFA